MKRDYSAIGIVYCLLLCWPSFYRLLLPEGMGNIAYYFVAYAVPLVAFLVVLWKSRDAATPLLLFLGAMIILVASNLLSTTPARSLGELIYAAKFYLTPMLLIIFGAFIARRMNAALFGNLLLTVLGGHLLFSLLFYYDILPNAVYSGVGEYSENWISVVGGYRAFVGLTLSKFDLAYQVGFVLIGAILCGSCFSTVGKRVSVIVLSTVLILFTYNKTVALVAILALFLHGYLLLRNRSRVAGHAVLLALGMLVVYPVVRFLNGDLVLTDLFGFLSPQTFWSRVMLWQDVMAFDWSQLIRGVGAGTFASQSVTLDNQFLYAYLEMGAIGALVYFTLFAALVLKSAPGKAYGKIVLCLLAAVFAVGDILNAHAMMFVVGLYLGQLSRKDPTEVSPVEQADRRTAGQTRLAKPMGV